MKKMAKQMTATIFNLGDGRFALNTLNGVSPTLTGVHYYSGHITHPRGGFREMGVLEIITAKDGTSEN